MATASMSHEALELLQQYRIDLKDFTKARARYQVVLHKELVQQEGEQANADVIAATKEAQDHLQQAWQEYLCSAQTYVNRLLRNIVGELTQPYQKPPARALKVMPTSASITSDAAPGLENSVTLSPSATSARRPPPLTMPVNKAANTSAVSVAETAAPTAAVTASASPTSTAPASPFDGASAAAGSPPPAAPAVKAAPPPPPPPPPPPTAEQRAERMNDFCLLCEKWFTHNEQLFELPSPEAVARLAASAVASVSRLMRLLGLRIALLCAGSVAFMRAFMEDVEAPQWVGLCGDREIYTEVEGFLSLMDRMLELLETDPKTSVPIPFGWLYRVSALLDPIDAMPNLPPKRRSQAIRVVIRLLKTSPAQATAASLHITAMRCCLAKGAMVLEETRAIVRVLLQLFSDPATRVYIRTSDLGVLFDPFLNTYTPTTAEYLVTLNNARDLLLMIMTTWVGNLWVSSETTSIRSLIDVLHLSSDLDRKMVILTLFNGILLRLAPHRGITAMDRWTGLEDDRRRKSAAAAAEVAANNTVSSSAAVAYDAMLAQVDEVDIREDFIPTTKALGYYVLDPLLGQVLFAFIYHGLPLALISVVRTTNTNRIATEAAGTLLQDMLVLMDTVLPKETVKNLYITFYDALGRMPANGNRYIAGIPSLHLRDSKAGRGPDAAFALEGTKQSNMQLSAMYGSAGSLDLDDATFRAILRETRVEASPTDFAAWNYDLLLLLVQGPLRSMTRFRGCTSLLKILIAFYTPRASASPVALRPFSTLQPEDATTQMCVLGIAFVDLLLTSREGAELLDAADFPKAVAAMLREVRANTPCILSAERVGSRVGQSMLRMTGRLSVYANGLVLMREHDLFEVVDGLFSKLRGTRLTAPSEGDTLESVCYQLLQYLYLGAVPNYGVCEEIRHTFQAALCSPSNTIRLCAAMQLKRSVWRDLSTSMRWGIETLVLALHDDFFSVIESAFKLLVSICLCSDEGLDYFISLFPTVLMESEVIHAHAKQLQLNALLYRIASRPSGFRFLQSYGWIEKELRRWEDSESVVYTALVEQLQAGVSVETLDPASGRGASGDASSSAAVARDSPRRHTRSYSDSMASIMKSGASGCSSAFSTVLLSSNAFGAHFYPIHFAGVLCRSAEGCALFRHSDLWRRSVQRLLDQPLPPDIAYDDSLSDESADSDDGDGDDLAIASEATHLVSLRNKSWREAEGSRGAQGRAKEEADAAVWGGAAHATEEYARQRKIHLLKQGIMVAPDTLLSAARGYKQERQSFSMDCVGDLRMLKDAILCVSLVGSSDVGYDMVNGVPGLVRRLTALSRFSSELSVRSMALLSSALFARSKQACEDLAKNGFTVVSNQNAYVSVDGVPYAVAFAHMKPTKSMFIARSALVNNSVARHAYAGYNGPGTAGISKRVYERVLALSNPVNRESAKSALYRMVRRDPQIFMEPKVRRLCLDACGLYQMRHVERKFVADLLDNSQLTPPPYRASKTGPLRSSAS